MLFKWDAKISLEPDLEDIIELCKENREASFLMKSFNDYVKDTHGIDLREPEVDHQLDDKNGKNSLIQYLRSEVGMEIDIAWKTEYYFFTAEVKTEEIGNVINLLNRANLLN